MGRTWPCFKMGSRIGLCFFHRRMRYDGFWNVWSSVCSRATPALMISWPLVPPQESRSETAEPAFLTLPCHHAAVWEGKEDRGDGWWVPASWCTNFQTLVSPYYFGDGPRTLTEYVVVYPYYIPWDTEFIFASIVFDLAVEIKDLRTETSEIFPLRERDLLKQRHTIMEAKSDWSLSSEMKRSGIKVFAATLRLAQSELSLKVKSSNAIELYRRGEHSQLIHHRNFLSSD